MELGSNLPSSSGRGRGIGACTAGAERDSIWSRCEVLGGGSEWPRRRDSTLLPLSASLKRRLADFEVIALVANSMVRTIGKSLP